MEVSIFHYHLNPGGVTRIIESQVAALRAKQPAVKMSLYAAECPKPEVFSKYGVEPVIIEELGYLYEDEVDPEDYKPGKRKLRTRLERLLDRDRVIHFHNLNLGKNPLITAVFSELAREGHKIFNHQHDFAEDRPANIAFHRAVIEDGLGLNLQDVLYPELPNYKFGTLNGFDLSRLQEKNIGKERLYILPNPVPVRPQEDLIDRRMARQMVLEKFNLDRDKKIITYPVRVIERKNIGEFILLSVLFRETASWLVTLPPQNPLEIAKYKRWLSFSKENGIRVIYEAGKKIDFTTLLRGSDFCVTTSCREGFGMVFLEPWALGTPVAGRDIPPVTADLGENGIELKNLYNTLLIPSGKDFKDLSEEEQRALIREAAGSEDLKAGITGLNPWMKGFLDEVPGSVIRNNINSIKNNYSLDQYGERLIEIYKSYT